MKLPRFKLTFWRAVLFVILALGLYATVVRFTHGLGASTHLSDAFPWGLWIGFDVLCGVMLAAGGFVLTGAVYLFHLKRLQPIVRPAVLTAFLGYSFVIVALLFDLGRPWRIWHPLVMWNIHSAMFEVAWCVMLYTTVLALEFSALIFERLGRRKLARVQHAISIPLIVLGVILSTLHQSSLGTLFLIVPDKLHPLWYTPMLPLLFFVSSVAVGLAMTIFESFLSAKAFGRQLELPLLVSLGKAMWVVLFVYVALRFQSLYERPGVLSLLRKPSYEVDLFWLEVLLGLALPLVLMSWQRVRETARGLYFVAVLVVLGFITNRMNVSITGMEGAAGVHYFPKWTELAVTASIVGLGFAIFGLAVKHLPVFPPAQPEAEAGVAAPAWGHVHP